jgi:transposase
MIDGARVRRADRSQLCWDMIDLDSQLCEDHPARVVWAFVESLDLSELYAAIKARDEVAGRPAADPRVLLSLWLYATMEGIGSSRALERLCASHTAYRWLRGGVSVNYHSLSDFRVAHGAVLDRILTESVTGLAAAGLISLDEIAVDGTKVAASAGRGSYRREDRLGRFESRAAERIAQLKKEVDDDPDASNRRRKAAQDRAARETAAKAAAAREQLEKLKTERAKQAKNSPKETAAKKEPQASTTDPTARLMRMADGGVRPAYNVLISATTDQQVIVGLAVSDRRNELGMGSDMIEDMERQHGRVPQRLLIDTKGVTHDEIDRLSSHPNGAITVYSPPMRDRDDVTEETERKRVYCRRNESEPVKAWRARMASTEGEEVYKRRKRIETINGNLKNHGMRRFLLRGFAKVRCEALIHAIAHNIRRAFALGYAFA